MVGEEINVDEFYTGGDEGMSASLDTKEAAQSFIQARLLETEKLAEEFNLKIKLSRSTVWGHKKTLANECPSTNIYYDPAQNTAYLSLINASSKDMNHEDVYSVIEISENHSLETSVTKQ